MFDINDETIILCNFSFYFSNFWRIWEIKILRIFKIDVYNPWFYFSNFWKTWEILRIFKILVEEDKWRNYFIFRIFNKRSKLRGYLNTYSTIVQIYSRKKIAKSVKKSLERFLSKVSPLNGRFIESTRVLVL